MDLPIPGGSYTIVVIAHAGRAGELTSENRTITAWTGNFSEHVGFDKQE